MKSSPLEDAKGLLFVDGDKSRIFAGRFSKSDQLLPALARAVIARGLLPSYCTLPPTHWRAHRKLRVNNSSGGCPAERAFALGTPIQIVGGVAAGQGVPWVDFADGEESKLCGDL